MLAVVHHFAGTRMLIGRCASSEIGTAFKEGHAKTAAGKGAARGQPGQSTSHHGDSGILCRALVHQERRFRRPLARIPSFSRTVRLTLTLKTSYWRCAIFSSSR